MSTAATSIVFLPTKRHRELREGDVFLTPLSFLPFTFSEFNVFHAGGIRSGGMFSNSSAVAILHDLYFTAGGHLEWGMAFLGLASFSRLGDEAIG